MDTSEVNKVGPNMYQLDEIIVTSKRESNVQQDQLAQVITYPRGNNNPHGWYQL